MGYDSRYAMTNAQLRNQGMQGAVDNFMGFFKAKKAADDEAQKTGMQGQISELSQGVQGNGDPLEAAKARKLAEVKAAYATKYGIEPATAQDFMAKDAMQGEQMNKIGDARTAREESKAQTGRVEKFRTAQTAENFYNMKPEAYGDLLKPVGITYLPGQDGYVGVPSKTGPSGASSPAAPVLNNGAPVKPVIHEPAARQTPAEIEAAAAAAARGKASVEKPLSAVQVQNVQSKIQHIQVARAQMENVKTAFEGIKGGLSAGPGGQLMPTENGQKFDAAVDGLKNTIRALTRTPGEGSMSDWEGKVAQAQLPSRGKYESVTQQQIDQLDQMIAILDSGYNGMVPAKDSIGSGPSQLTAPASDSGTVWRRAKDGREYEYNAQSKQPTGKSR